MTKRILSALNRMKLFREINRVHKRMYGILKPINRLKLLKKKH